MLDQLLRQRVKRVYTIGAAAAKIESQILSSKDGGTEVVHAETLDNAIRKASAAARERATLFCLRRPVPASINSKATSIAARFSKKSSNPCQPPQQHPSLRQSWHPERSEGPLHLLAVRKKRALLGRVTMTSDVNQNKQHQSSTINNSRSVSSRLRVEMKSPMAKRVSVDRWLFTVTMLLVFLGLVMVFSASAVMARERFGSPYAFLSKQLICAVAGLLAMVVTMRVDYRRYKHPAIVFSLMGVTTLLLISVFFLDRSHNTHRWIHAGVFSFQPSELAKPVLILFLAYFLESRARTMDDVRNTLLPAAAPVVVFLGLIVLQPDLGTAIACAGIAACILYVAGMRLRYFGYAFGASLLPLYLLIFHVAWRRDRILAFLNPYADRQRTGFHIIQSLIAVGTGGITGTGLMEGKQKLFYLPEPHTDFIFAVTAEELGLVGAMFVVTLFAVFLWRGMRTSWRTQDVFGRYLAVGITIMVVLQAFINISVVLGMMPTKGIPLPLVSYGGSSLFVTLACVGVLLNISKQAE